jgi:hypothetical protein
MIRACLPYLMGAALLPSFAFAMADVADLALPSGQSVQMHEVLTQEDVVRFRLIAPEITRDAGGLKYADVELDFQQLCEEYALHWLDEKALRPEQIVISLADRAVPFGAADASATQFFEAFSRDGARCVWEQF